MSELSNKSTSIIRIKQKEKDVFILPDNTTAYSMKRALREYKKIKPVKYTVSDLILFLLFSQDKPIRGRIVLFKELFIFEKSVFNEESVEDCKFIPYHYGPYSFHVEGKLENMIQSGLIEEEMEKGSLIATYSLKPKGKRLIKKKYVNLPIKLRDKIEKWRKGLDQFSTQISEYVYRNPEWERYLDKSKIRYKFKLISWGTEKR